MLHCLYETAKPILELLYFASGIVIAVAAVLALEQIKLTKRIAKQNARRESVKLAAEQCRYFAERVMPAYNDAVTAYHKNKLKFLDRTQPGFVVKNGEITQQTFDLKLMEAQLPT